MSAKPNKMLSALYGGLIMGVISGVPFLNFVNCCCCAGIMLGGFLAVFFYKNDIKPDMPPLTSNDALAVGALAGVFGAVVSSVLEGAALLAFGNLTGKTIADLITEIYGRAGILDQLPPQALDQLHALELMKFTPLMVLRAFILHPLFGLIGGLIGYAVFKPKQIPLQPPAVPMP
jgi:hypothetical protein